MVSAAITRPKVVGLNGTASPGGQRARRPVRVAVGAVLVVLCALLGALVFARADHTVSVLVVTRGVRPGQVITASDLGVARISVSGVTAMPVSSRASVVGKTADVGLVPGSVLVSGDVGPVLALVPGSVEVPMSLKTGMFPPGLVVGDQVLVIPTPGPGQQTTSPPAAAVPGKVTGMAVSSSFEQTATATVTVSVASASAVAVADAAANGQVVLAQVAQ